jgi:integrase/recombinase XerD
MDQSGKILKRYVEVLGQKRYGNSTIKIYSCSFCEYINHFANSDINSLEPEEINDYIVELINDRSISASQQNQRISAIKFYYEKILDRKKMVFSLYRPRREKKLPDVLSKEEIKRILTACANLKHRAILSLIYSSGLRRSEPSVLM